MNEVENEKKRICLNHWCDCVETQMVHCQYLNLNTLCF